MISNDSSFYRFHAFALLALVTLLYAVLFDPYSDHGPELLVNGDFSQGLAAPWQHSKGVALAPGDVSGKATGAIRLYSEDDGTWVVVKQQVVHPGNIKKVRLRAGVKTREVKKGKRDWHRARLVLGSYDKAGQWLPGPHHVALLDGSNGWQEYSKVFNIPRSAVYLQVLGQLPRATGTMWIKSVSLCEVILKPVAGILDATFFSLWSAYLFWLIASLAWQKRPLIMRALMAIAVLAVLIGTLSPGTKQVQWQEGAVVAIQKIIEPTLPQSLVPDNAVGSGFGSVWKAVSVKKKMVELSMVGHFAFFVILAMVSLGYSEMRADLLLVDIGLFAGVTEFLQLFIRGRTPLVTDWMLDFSGAALGVALVLLYRLQIRRMQKDSRQNC